MKNLSWLAISTLFYSSVNLQDATFDVPKENANDETVILKGRLSQTSPEPEECDNDETFVFSPASEQEFDLFASLPPLSKRKLMSFSLQLTALSGESTRMSISAAFLKTKTQGGPDLAKTMPCPGSHSKVNAKSTEVSIVLPSTLTLLDPIATETSC